MTHSLLHPRYIVEAQGKKLGELPYPNSPYTVGQIIDFSEVPEFKSGNVIGADLPQSFYDDFPNIFRKLNWWEYRSLDEMPRYLKDVVLGKVVIKVDRYKAINNEWYFISEANKDIEHTQSLNKLTPAAEDEYINYLKSKQNESI